MTGRQKERRERARELERKIESRKMKLHESKDRQTQHSYRLSVERIWGRYGRVFVRV